MSNLDVIRAWKDEDYRASLSAAQRAALPANPAGAVELSDVELGSVAAGFTTPVCTDVDTRRCGTCTGRPVCCA